MRLVQQQVPQVILQADTPPHPGTPGSVCGSEDRLAVNPASLPAPGSSSGGGTLQQFQQDPAQQQQQALMNAHMLQQQVRSALSVCICNHEPCHAERSLPNTEILSIDQRQRLFRLLVEESVFQRT